MPRERGSALLQRTLDTNWTGDRGSLRLGLGGGRHLNLWLPHTLDDSVEVLRLCRTQHVRSLVTQLLLCSLPGNVGERKKLAEPSRRLLCQPGEGHQLID